MQESDLANEGSVNRKNQTEIFLGSTCSLRKETAYILDYHTFSSFM